MKTLYLECNMGAAGDMLMAALLELHDDPDGLLRRLNGAGIPGVAVQAEPAVRCGIRGTHITVSVNGAVETSEDVDGGEHPAHHHEHAHEHGHHHDHVHDEHEHGHRYGHDHAHGHEHAQDHDHGHAHSHGDRDHGHEHHHHSGLHEIGHLVEGLAVSDRVKADALAVYRLIAEAESHAHGVPVEQVHFHEVGSLDAVADIVGVCLLLEELAPERILASPVHVGCGQVRCAHGILPVPAPATAYILRDVPVYGGRVRGELCTPTGAALLRHFAADFGGMPVMTLQRTGYGMGGKEFEVANCVRAFWGETARGGEEVVELCCNLDDMTPEAVAFAQQLLMDEGALDVYTAPIGMKKGRSGILFTCMCRSSQRDKFVSLLFRHTTTLGMRETVSRRHTLRREGLSVQTPYGPVRVKRASGHGVHRAKPEYEDLARIAREHGISLDEAARSLPPLGKD